MGRVFEISELVNGLARIKISRAPALGPARTVQVPARAAEMGRTCIPSAANLSRHRHPLRSSGEQLAHDRQQIDRRGAAARASTAAMLVGEEEEAGVADAAWCVDVNHRPVGNPKRKVWWVQQPAFPSVRNQGLIISRKKPNSRRWCWLALWQLRIIYKAPHPVLCFASCNAEPAHNITKYFALNLRWGCQSHRFAINKGMSVSSEKQ
jgi:hypothetical protein